MAVQIRFANGSVHNCKLVGQSKENVIVLFQGRKYAVSRKNLVSVI